MKVVRQWMTKKLFSDEFSLVKALLLTCFLTTVSSCNPTELTARNARSNVIANNGTMDGKAFVYEDSPFYLAGPNYGPGNVDMAPLLNQEAKFITDNTRLTSDCGMTLYFKTIELSECIRVLSKASGTDQPLPRKSDRTYIYATNSPEFYQVNTLYHINKGTHAFLQKLQFAYDVAQDMRSYSLPKSIPYYLRDTNLFWFKAMSSIDRKIFNNDYLVTYAQCELEGNASFSPAGPTLCFGGLSDFKGFSFTQDPEIIYHELGHAFVSIMMNMRNGTSSSSYHPFRSNLGFLGYDEAGSINEGIADYFSFVVNSREEFGEYALGKTFSQARPLSEASHLHSLPGIEESPVGRLSYPQYLLHDPNNPEDLVEDVHYAGQIVTHYLVALTKSLKSECLSGEPDGGHDRATSITMLLLAETLSELGDLNAKGVDLNSGSPFSSSTYFNNLDYTNSFLWTQLNNPVTYRRFFQVFAKNINKYVSFFSPSSARVGFCPSFDKNKSERLLDDYGLLLFRTYNDDGTSTKSRLFNYSNVAGLATPSQVTEVSENNRRKSLLISKQLIELAKRTDANPTRVGFYIIDNSTDMAAVLQEMLFKGLTIPLSPNVAGTIYNNNNIKISPGEVVGIIPNLLNNSNSTMAGVQLLATDWDHVHIPEENLSTGNFRPCVKPAIDDPATTVDQGGEAGKSCMTTDTDYKRLIKNISTNQFPSSAAAPVCMVLLEEGESSKWVSQNEFRRKQGLSLLDKDCLGHTTSTQTDQDFSFNPHECLVRFLPGANEAFFSKIEAQKTYYETVIKDSAAASFNVGNVMIMEVNKWIPPGTKFRCRMRARFSNCSDCYTDGSNRNDDYIDAEYNGSKPFKVINFDFDVND